MEDVIAQWNADFKPIQKEVESLNPIARGKVVHTSMVLDDPSNRKSGTVTGLNIRNNVSSHIPGRRPSSQMMITGPKSPSRPTENRIARIPSSGASPSLSRNEYEDAEQEPDRDSHLSPAYTPRISHSPGGPTRDYFSRSRQPSQDSLQEVASPALSAIAVKKKPPPPPPKRLSSYQKEIWVTALYSFDGQEAGDLSFREGDRIKVVKKTASTDDWWDGELRGHRGRFPANYCEMN
jgi:amphiphysin